MKTFSKRLLTMLLAAAMVFGLNGMTAFAAEAEESAEPEAVSGEETKAATLSADGEAALSPEEEGTSASDGEAVLSPDEEAVSSPDDGGIQTLTNDQLNDIDIYKNGEVILTITADEFAAAAAVAPEQTLCYYSGGNYDNPTYVTAHFVKVSTLLQGYEPDPGCGIAANSNFSYAGMDLDNFYLYDDTEPPTDPYQYHGIRSAVDGSRGAYWVSDVTSLTIGHDYNANGVCRICGEELGMGENYNVKYAVSLWGIEQDEDRYGNTLGLTFGPATGGDYTNDYKAHLTKEEYDAGGVCLHWMSWDEIIEMSEEEPEAFQECLEHGCTHSVNLNLNTTLLATTYATKMDSGDGAGVLFDSINPTYLRWNGTADTTGGWPASQMRATLNGLDRLTGSATNALDTSDCLLSCFPSNLRSAIVAKAVPSDTVYDSDAEDDVQTTYDKLWLPSGKETYGEGGSNNAVIRANEGSLFRRSVILGITTENASDLASCDETGSNNSWWLRSLNTSSSGSVFRVSDNGAWGYNTANDNNPSGIAPCFCLRGLENATNDTYYDVKYAVSIWGINHDVDENGIMLGLTFGPATGESYLKDYKAHLTEAEYNDGEGVCLHWMTWEEIIAQCKTDPTVFTDCLRYGCTHAVNLTLNDTIIGQSYADEMDDGDGVGELYDSLNSTYRQWNEYSASTDGGWAASKIRATLNGADSHLNSNNADPLYQSDCLLSCFPAALQEAIVPRKVKAATVAGSEAKNDITITHDSLWLFSASELWDYGGSRDSWLNPMEGRLYERQIAWGITTGANSLMGNYREDGTSSWWFTRTKYSNAYVVCGMENTGYPYNVSPSGSYSISPGFCLPGTGKMMPTDKSVLQKEYDDDSLLDENDYTPETWAPFKEALDAASDVLATESVTQENVDDALEALRDAKDALIPKQPVLSLTVSSNIANDTKTYNRATVTLTATTEVIPTDSSITYQWYKVSGSTATEIPGAIDSEYVLDGNVADSGTYRCVAIAQYEDLTDRQQADITITINPESQNISYATTNVIKRDIDEDFTNPLTRTLVSTDAESSITYKSSDDSIAYVDPSTGKVEIRDLGTVTITATAADTPNYTGASASYTLKIYDSALRVNYAVKIWGIGTDWYSLDGGETALEAGLTFGPATGESYVESYKAHLTKEENDADNGKYCIHWMDWDEIIAQSEEDPSVFEDCLESGCTKNVELTPNADIFNIDTVENAAAQNYTGDGVSTLYWLLNGAGGTGNYTYGAVWNSSSDGNSTTDPANVYSRSRIRTTLTGDRDNITAWRSANSGANDYYGISTLCDETNCLLSCFPEELQKSLVPRRTLNSGNATTGNFQYDDETTYDRLFLFSTKETGITNTYDDGGGEDYGVNSSNSARIAYEFTGTDSANINTHFWWTRSRYAGDDGEAFRTGTSGNYSYSYVYSGNGLSPGFSLPGPDEESVPEPDQPTVENVTVTSDLDNDAKTYNGTGVTLTAEAEFTPDTAEVTYQWYKRSSSGTYESLGEATTDNCLELDGNVSDSGTYRCVVTATNDWKSADDSGEITITINRAAQNIYFEKDSVTVKVGEEHYKNDLTEATNPPNEDEGARITYRSSNPEVATVDGEGNVSILTVGETTIYATAAATANYIAMTVSYVLTVVEDDATPPSVGDVTITSTLVGDTKEYDGKGITLTATADVTPDTAEVTYQWYKKSESGAYEPIEDEIFNTLNLEGNVSDSGTYRCVVTATNDGYVEDGKAEIAFTITAAAQDISYAQTSAEKVLGSDDFTNPLTVTVLSTDADACITYSSSNPEVAIVDEKGSVTLLAAGETTITATAVATANYSVMTACYDLTVVEDKHPKVENVTITSTLVGDTKDYDGKGITLTARANVTPNTAEVTYQWYKMNESGDYEPIEDAIFNLLNIEGNVSDSGTYRCVVTATNEGYVEDGAAEIAFTINPAAQVISYAQTSVEKVLGNGDFTNELIKTVVSEEDGAGITYAITEGDEGVAEIDPATGKVTILGAGQVTITATAAETANYKEASASYTLTVALSDKTALRVAISAAEALEGDEEHYTPDTWETYENALSHAREVEADDGATEDAVRTATLDLMAAIANLVPVEEPEVVPADDKTALLDAYVKASNLTESDYTLESWQALAEALAEAQELLVDPYATQAKVDAATDALNKAMDELVKAVDKSALDETIAQVEEEMDGLDASDYSPSSWSALEEALKAAQDIASEQDATQQAVDQAQADLESAAAGLVKTADLQAEYDEDSALSEADYTEDSWAPFAEALETAGDLLVSGDATQTVVDEALAALQNAKENLMRAADKTALRQVIPIAETLLQGDKDNYTQDSWDALQNAYDAAVDVEKDSGAGKDAVDNATIELIRAIAGLTPEEQTPEEEVDKTVLKGAIDAVEALSSSKDDYTTDSWEALANALTEAQGVYEDEDATQEDIDNAASALVKALADLSPAKKSDTGTTGGTYTGFEKEDDGHVYYVENNVITGKKDGIIKDVNNVLGDPNGWYYVIGSEVQFDYTNRVSDFSNEYGWWYIKDGKVDFSANTVAKNKNGWWYVTGGKVQFGFTGLADYANENGWWYIDHGKVDFTRNSVDHNKNGWWYVTGGKVQFGFTGLAHYKNQYGWWYVNAGKVDFKYNGIASNQNGTWYIIASKVHFEYSGTVTSGGRTYTVRYGRVS